MLKDIRNNIILLTDCYNLSHFELKENLDYDISHIYNRSKPMILYGFNEIVIDLLNRKIEVDMVEEAQDYARKMGMHFPFDMFYKIATDLKGRIPLRVQALPDGTWVPKGTPFAQISNTEEGFGELVSWWEAVMIHSYFASGCATEAFWLRKYLEDNKLPLHRFHSFGFRGHHSIEDAYWAGTAWNLFLTGTDDFHTIMHTPNAKIGSIPATAHKSIQPFDVEMDAFRRAIDAATTYEQKMVALVIDTYDPWEVIEHKLYDILNYAKERGVYIIFRPDSGDLLEQALAINRNYSNWNNWSVIIGEGMSRDNITKMDKKLIQFGFPPEKMSYGIGAGFYKHIDRDWLGHAMKTAYSNGAPRMKLVKSNPFKQSIPDMVNLVMVNGKMTVEYTRDGEHGDTLYHDVYHYDERSTKPKFERQTWDDIQRIALKALEPERLQINVKLSPLVDAKIQEFKNQYI